MSPRNLMILGAFSGLFSIFVMIVADVGSGAVLCFAAGAVFGKGYGVWEVRSALAATGKTQEGET